MLIKKEVLEKLCPSYQKAVKKFEEEYSLILEDQNEFLRKTKLFEEFWQNYLMLPEFWDECYRSHSKINARFFRHIYNFYEESMKMTKFAAYHHFYDNKYPNSRFINAQKSYYGHVIYHFRFWHKFTLDELEYNLTFAQKCMDRTFRHYQEHFYSPIPKKLIKKFYEAKKLYQKILEAENDLNKWFNLIIKAENKKFIKNNIEFKLGKDLFNQELWKLYFNYLKQNDTKGLLHLYSCYCRLFIDDVEMKEEYKNACKIYGPSFVPWNNLFEHEQFEGEEASIAPYPSCGTPVPPRITPDRKFTFDNKENQIFPFPKTVISLILKCYRNPNIIHKLHKCCKYFFSILPYPVCHNFRLCNSDLEYFFNEQSVGIFVEPVVLFEHKLIISNTLAFWPFRGPRNALTTFLPQIFQCFIKHLRLYKQDLSIKEFKFLVAEGNVETLTLEDVKLLNEKDENMKLEEILKLTPKIIDIEFHQPFITPKTFQELLKLNFANKIDFLRLDKITYFEPYEFCEFIKKNYTPDSEFWGHFENGTDPVIIETAKSIIKKELWPKWPVNDSYLFSLH